jgi:nitroreductase
MQSFIELAKHRYSSRKYQNKAISRELIDLVLEAGRIAPTAANKQPNLFYVFTSETGLNNIKSCYHREWYKEAPVIIAICADHALSWKRADGKDHSDIDVAIAVDHMTLAATDLGLATCWICNFDVAKAREVLQLPENIEPVVLLPLAYPADVGDPERHAISRKNRASFVKYL